MARLELLLQSVTTRSHGDALEALIRHENSESILMSVAYVRESGVKAVEAALRDLADKTTMFVGIRNDITSVQAIKRLLSLGIKVYAVDTASRERIFHPKLYLATSKDSALLVVGSANLTRGGLYANIEASTIAQLDLTNVSDRDFVAETKRAFHDLPRQHPRHVFEVEDEEKAGALFLAGRLADETFVPAPPIVRPPGNGARDNLPRMNLHRVPKRDVKKVVRRRTQPTAGAPADASTRNAITPLGGIAIPEYYQVWESNGLTERDLNVPSGSNTARTGSMTLRKGALEEIDQRHFFRDEVFRDLIWVRDPKKQHLERATADFQLMVKGINSGQFKLRLTHNTRTDSKTYKQKNAMTSLHWDDAIGVVRRRDLLKRTMHLYRKDAEPAEFMIEID
jgi:HKD family nuclease